MVAAAGTGDGPWAVSLTPRDTGTWRSWPRSVSILSEQVENAPLPRGPPLWSSDHILSKLFT